MTAASLTLPRSAAAWDSPSFLPTLVEELQALGPHHPAIRPLLQAALAQTSAVAETPLNVQLLRSQQSAGRVQVHIGVFYAGVIAGCNCADDPTPVDTITEHCELLLDFDAATGRARVAASDD